ncbi:MAG: DUF2933 domain-containing protein [Acidiferrobacterales bacterium]
MEWLTENWIWVLIGIAFLALHFLGHGRHGKGGKQDKPGKQPGHQD